MTRAVRLFSSLGLSCVLLIFLGLLTWLGTLEQVHSGLYDVQKRYFESWFLVHRAGPVPIPLPGGQLVMSVLALNLLVGGIVRLRKSRGTLGILVTHVGIALLLGAALVKLRFSDDGHVTLYEGQSSANFQSYNRWEISIARESSGAVREYLVPQEHFAHATAEQPVTLRSPELPFALVVERFLENCAPLPKGPMFEVDVPIVDGVFLQQQEELPQRERNAAGTYVTAIGAHGERSEGLLWGLEQHPWTVQFGGERFAIDLRRERYPMPFAVTLDEFTKEDHPRSSMPRSFESDVTVAATATTRPVTISMNKPLREGGLVLYQASWGPSTARPGDPLFSTLAVVRNPADQWPLWSCVVIALGLVMHFSRTLMRYVRAEVSAR